MDETCSGIGSRKILTASYRKVCFAVEGFESECWASGLKILSWKGLPWVMSPGRSLVKGGEGEQEQQGAWQGGCILMDAQTLKPSTLNPPRPKP